MSNDDAALVLSRVTARFADERDKRANVLHEVSLAVARGSFVSFTGPSGAGKTTLMRVILGLMGPSSGVITRNFVRSAMVFQNYALFPWLSALENVAYGLRMSGIGKKARRAQAREKLAEVGLEKVADHYPAALSGGQRQRVGLARALAVEPDLLIMDEPFSNLDTITAEALKADLIKIWRDYGMTILMVNHLIPDAVELSDRVVVLAAHPGRICKTVDIELVRPREVRSPAFFREVEKLTEAIRVSS